MVQSLKQSWEEFRAVVPPHYSIKLKRGKLNNLPVIFVCEFLYTKGLVAAYGKQQERRSRERIGDEDELAEMILHGEAKSSCFTVSCVPESMFNCL